MIAYVFFAAVCLAGLLVLPLVFQPYSPEARRRLRERFEVALSGQASLVPLAELADAECVPARIAEAAFVPPRRPARKSVLVKPVTVVVVKPGSPKSADCPFPLDAKHREVAFA